MAVRTVIFDWGGTLTPWHSIDVGELWLAVCARHYPADEAAAMAAAVHEAEMDLWRHGTSSHQSATLERVFEQAGFAASDDFLASYFEAWDPHTFTDPDVLPLLHELKRRGIRVGVLSNTMWPRTAHEKIFVRDEVLNLIDGAVYTSEIEWVKPHPEAFRAAMAAVGETDPSACVFVGDRPYDDIHGAKSAGMRAVLVANSDVPAFAAAEPDAAITRLADLLPYIDRWSLKNSRRKALAKRGLAALTFGRESSGRRNAGSLPGGDAPGVPRGATEAAGLDSG